MEPDYDARKRNKSYSSSDSRKISRSRSRTYSKERRKNHHRHRSLSRSGSHSLTHSASYKSANVNINRSDKKPALNFMIFLSKIIENSLTSGGVLKKIEDQIGEVKLYFQPEFTIPDYEGCVLNIKSEEMRRKKDATQNLLEYIVKNDIDNPEGESKKHSEKISVFVMVPNGLISMIIGTKGRMISNLIRDSGANIVVNQPIYKMLHRTVAISGKPYNIANAIEMIQTIMEERYYEVSKVDMEFKPLNVTTTQTKVINFSLLG
jgi:hypothetical protein